MSTKLRPSIPADAPVMASLQRGLWKPGITDNGETHRPFLNGQPCPGAIAADSVMGFVRFAPETPDGLPTVRNGYVELRRVPEEMR